jgi:hypothetical protein
LGIQQLHNPAGAWGLGPLALAAAVPAAWHLARERCLEEKSTSVRFPMCYWKRFSQRRRIRRDSALCCCRADLHVAVNHEVQKCSDALQTTCCATL